MNNSTQCIICGEPLGDEELLVFVTHDGECSRMLAENRRESEKRKERNQKKDEAFMEKYMSSPIST